MIRLVAALSLMLATTPAIADSYRDTAVPMQVDTGLDLNRYSGLWYEIARFPNRFEKNCFAVTAEYALREDGKISVVNTCRTGAVDGPVKQAEGVAIVAEPGKLEVGFAPGSSVLPFLRGDYWVLDVTPDYSVAVVGTPAGRTGWILARSPQISDAALSEAMQVLSDNGYDVTELRAVPQMER
ncbi:lipocalin family protein [Shimia biformata]|uniref:lipocalin family protein n=1 Tax=Shimia biformata TaxID=1294299 RepID=UPI0030840AFC